MKTYQSPVYNVIAVPIEKIVPNTYNPNAVAPPEMKLLYESIKVDGYTMPIVCYYAKEQDHVHHRRRLSPLPHHAGPPGYLRARGRHAAGFRHRQAASTTAWPAPSATTGPGAPTTWT